VSEDLYEHRSIRTDSVDSHSGAPWELEGLGAKGAVLIGKPKENRWLNRELLG
jgi:hypothetical protein